MDVPLLLRSIELFKGLSDDDLVALAGKLKPVRFTAGTMIFAMGDVGSSMYIIERGDINIHLPGEDSRRISLKDIARGEYFGELALFDEKPRSASALATTDTDLLELQRSTLADYLQTRPGAAMAILRTMGERLRETNRLLFERAAKNVDEEFDKNLSWGDRLADRVAELNGSWAFITLLLIATTGWCLFNTAMLAADPLDPYPYQFFNLALAILVALQGPLIVMSQNRQSAKDRARADTDYKVNLKNEVNIETLLRELSEFRAEAKAAADLHTDRVTELHGRVRRLGRRQRRGDGTDLAAVENRDP